MTNKQLYLVLATAWSIAAMVMDSFAASIVCGLFYLGYVFDKSE